MRKQPFLSFGVNSGIVLNAIISTFRYRKNGYPEVAVFQLDINYFSLILFHGFKYFFINYYRILRP